MFYRVLINNIQIQKSKILKGNLKDMTYYTHKHPCTMHPVVYYHGTAAACLPDVTT
jgi:plasmid rolling circle replication initiator protein Rep